MVCNDPQVAAYIKANFIPVANDDVAYRFTDQKDKLAYKVMARVMAQNTDDGRQGIYGVTSSGKLLSYNRFYDADEVLSELEAAVEAYRSMPRRERVIGGRVAADDGIGMLRRPSFPIIDIRVTKRSLPNDAMPESDVRHEQFFHFDYLWLKPSEIAALVPARREVGARVRAPEKIVRRFIYSNLLVLEHRAWLSEHVERAVLESRVTRIRGDTLELTLEGEFRMKATNYEHNDGSYDGRLLGKLVVSAETGALERFEAVALGRDIIYGDRGEETGPPENTVGALFELNPQGNNEYAFPSGYPDVYYDW